MISSHKLAFISFVAFCHMHHGVAGTLELPEEDAGTDSPSPLHILDSQLLLPNSYRQYLPALQRAAQLASNNQQCTKFLQGGLQLDRSTADHPVFRILCRNETNQSYALLVDGLSFHLLDETRAGGSISFVDLRKEQEAERERQRILAEEATAVILAEAKRLNDIELLKAAAEAARLEEERRQMLWNYCLQQLQSRVRNMQGLVWLTNTMPEPKVGEDNRLTYYIDFDAQDLYRQPLYYRAECQIQDKDDHALLIRPRRDSKN